MIDQRGLRVGFITQWFAPEPVTNPVWIASALVEQEMHLGVVTGIPNYPQGKVMSPYVAYRAYREQIGGLPIIRTPLYPSHDQSPLRRGLNYISFALSATIGASRFLSHTDVNLVYASPATAALPAMFARRFKGVPYVLYVQDIWPDSVLETGLVSTSRLVSWGVGALSRFVTASYKNAAHVVVISEGMRKILLERGVSEAKVSVIHNWAGESLDQSEENRKHSREALGIEDDDVLVIYAGNHGEAQALDAWIDAIRRLVDIENLRFIFVGEGSRKRALIERAEGIPSERLKFVEGIDPSDIGRVIIAADALVISLADEAIFKVTIPGKVQANLAAGKAIVASVNGDAEVILKASNGAIIASPEDVESIELALRKLYASGFSGLAAMGQSARRYYDANLSKVQGSRKLARVLTKVVTGDSE